MPVSTEPSTFEYARDWLVSSETFVRDAMLAELPGLDESRDQARERIHREEALDEPDEEAEGETAPDLPPPFDDRPRAIIITRGDERSRVGTGTWGGNGQLLVCMEVLVPDEHRVNEADDDAPTKAAKFKARKAWATQLCNTIRLELRDTSGQGDADGTPYLNARRVNVFVVPGDPEEGEPSDYIAWMYEVDWN